MHSDLAAILVIRLGSLGDVLLTTPVLRELSRIFPHAELHYVTRERYRDLLLHHPCVRELHLIPNNPGVVALIKAGIQLRSRKFDLSVDLHHSIRSAVIRSTLGATSEIVYRSRRSGRFCSAGQRSNGVPWTSLAERFLDTLAPLGVQSYPERLELHWDEAAEEKAGMLAGEMDGPLVAIAPGARWPTKRWLPEGFASVADALVGEHRASVVIMGDARDKPVSDQVVSLMDRTARPLTGALSILEAAALLNRCRLLVCNDSGLLHMARATGTPAVAIFGPTGPELGYYPWEPYAKALSLQMPCSPCTSKGSRRCPKRHFRCMRDLSPEAVLEAAHELWKHA